MISTQLDTDVWGVGRSVWFECWLVFDGDLDDDTNTVRYFESNCCISWFPREDTGPKIKINLEIYNWNWIYKI